MNVLWALDVFETDLERLRGMAALLRKLATPEELHVAYVASPGEPRLNLAFDIEADERFTSYPRSLMTLLLSRLRLKLPVENAHILTEVRVSARAGEEQLAKLARKEKTDVLALFTHAQSGVKRWFVGSFAEAMIHRSPVPILVVNPLCDPPRAAKRILFATDLSPGSNRAARKAAAFAKSVGAELIIFHAAEPFVELEYSGVTAPGFLHAALERRIDAQARRLQRTGVAVKPVVVEQFGATHTRILEGARANKADVIAMAAQKGPLAALIGSVTRKVIRESTLPVLVLRS